MKNKFSQIRSRSVCFLLLTCRSGLGALSIAFTFILILSSPVSAQTVLGGETPDNSAILDLQSNSKGLLLPRLTTAQRDAIANPQSGLLIYNTSLNCVEINVGTPVVPSWNCLETYVPGTISALYCYSAVVSGMLMPNVQASGVSAKVPYTGGNGGPHNGQSVTSTGVTGLTATLTAGNFANGADSLTCTISGTPSAAGTASFALNIGGQSCTLELTVAAAGSSCTCCAKINATDYKNFMCHNLGAANTSADPLTPSWEINGGYWQWGRAAQAAAGPTGDGAGETNEGPVPGWDSSYPADGSWLDASKSGNDPCPSGFRVPTKDQWAAVVANNAQTPLGSWGSSSTNYSSGRTLGAKLMLPGTGWRVGTNGSLINRGFSGLYWSSTHTVDEEAWSLYLDSGGATWDYTDDRRRGFSIRCIAEDAPAAGTIGALDCGSANPTGTLTAGTAASGVSASVPYTGGNGGTHSGQTVTSTGVTGLTATLAVGSFANGTGNLSYAVTGMPSGAGTASFALNIGGQSCTLELTVGAAGGCSSTCCAKVSATEYKEFLCFNLGAANTSVDPFTPSWEIIGGYWQWGRLAQAAEGPNGPSSGEANSAAVPGWNVNAAASNAWLDASKTGNDPCLPGYRVPTKAQWEGVAVNNASMPVGTWTNNATNYSSGVKLGDKLFLPAAGGRQNFNGILFSRGFMGTYWSTTESPDNPDEVFSMFVSSSSAFAGTTGQRPYGRSIRCIKE